MWRENRLTKFGTQVPAEVVIDSLGLPQIIIDIELVVSLTVIALILSSTSSTARCIACSRVGVGLKRSNNRQSYMSCEYLYGVHQEEKGDVRQL